MKLRYSKYTPKQDILDDYAENYKDVVMLEEKMKAIKEKISALKKEMAEINRTYKRRYGEDIIVEELTVK